MNHDDLFGDDPLIARLVGYGIAAIIVLVLLLAPLASRAQTTPPEPACLPSGILSGTGTDYKVFETADVHGEVGWCPSTGGGWHIAIHRWCLKTVCDTAPANAFTIFMGALARVRAAADPVAQVQAEWATLGIPPRTPLETWQLLDWRYQACQWLSSTQPGAMDPRPPLPIPLPKVLPTDVDWVAPPGWCDPWTPGAKPVPPPTPCAAATVTWSQGTAQCSAAYAGGASGDVANVLAAGPNTGSATATCVNGSVQISAGTCSLPAVVYVVTPNGTQTTRQWFLALQQPDGSWKRSTSPGGTTPVGGTCDCATINILEFNITRYCKVPVTGVNAVAACMVKK